MPICKYCRSRITRFDKDICPICGTKNPLEGVSSETVEITSNFDLTAEELKTFRPHTKLRTSIFLATLGWTGLAQFYLHYNLQAVLWMILELALIAGGFTLFYFVANMGIVLSIVLPIVIVYVLNIALAIITYFKHNLKDAKGEFLR